MLPTATSGLPNWLAAADLAPALLEVSLTGIVLLLPMHAPDSPAIIDFVYVYLNPAAQRMLHLSACPTETFLTRFPHVEHTGVLAFCCAVFEQATTSYYSVYYPHDGLDDYYHLAARRSGPVVVVSFTSTAEQSRTAAEQALRESQARERATSQAAHHHTNELLRAQQQLTEDLQCRVRERTQALQSAHAATEQQRTLLTKLLLQAPVAICILSGPTLVYELVNPAYEEIFPRRQVPGQSLLGHSLLEAWPEAAPVYRRLQEMYNGGRVYEAYCQPIVLARADGTGSEERYFNFINRPRHNEQGDIDGVFTFAFEVTEQVCIRQQAEVAQGQALAAAQQLAAQREGFFQVFEQTPALVCILRGPDHRMTYHNPAFQQLYAGRELLGRPVAETQPEAVAQGFVALLDQLYVTGQPYQARQVQGLVQGPEGGPPDERYFDFTYQPIREQGEVVGVSVFAFEVTEQVLSQRQVAQSQAQQQQLTLNLASSNQELAAANQELAAANEELAAANDALIEINQQLLRTNVDLDTFIYTASHDLRTPITNIEGLLNALRADLPQASQVGDVPYMLGLMQESVNRFKRTIGHLTDIASLQREQSPPVANVVLAEIIQDVCLDLAPLFAQVAVRLDVAVGNCPPIAFATKNLRSVVYNLLSNALKYRHPDRVLHVRLHCRLTNNYIILDVQDNGLGLDLDQHPKLFGLFQRFHTHIEGTGIGLYMVKRIVENAGGQLTVQSQVGLGSTFSVYFRR